jgi:NADPH:quinone reductase-like Zn-dependent oxidoreductase
MSDIQSFNKVMNKISEKKYTPIIDKIFPMKDIRLAHEYIEERQQMGKVIVVP